MSCPSPNFYGKSQDGERVKQFTLANRTGMQVVITNYGATIVSLKAPDREGNIEDVVLGYDTLEDYEKGDSYFGATIGRYANRIAKGKFALHGKTYSLAINNPPNALHGGIRGFSKRAWTVQDRPVEDGTLNGSTTSDATKHDSSKNDPSSSHAQTLQLHYLSPDGEEGFPGDLAVAVSFSIPEDRNELTVEYSATADSKDTVINLTNHSYFNLGGAGNGDILNHELQLYASHFTPVDATMIPTGEFRSVAGTPFDFTRPTRIGERISANEKQLEFGRGYDHNWMLAHQQGQSGKRSLDLAAELFDPKSGRTLTVLTTEPGIQFYSGNFLDESIRGKHGRAYGYRSALCLETQHFPDSPNHPEFPTTILKAGEMFRSSTIYKFSVK